METLEAIPEKVLQWQGERLGKITASEVWKLMKSGRGKEEYFSHTGLSYISEKLAELFTGERAETPPTRAIEWGKEHEEQAACILADKLVHPMNYFGVDTPKFDHAANMLIGVR